MSRAVCDGCGRPQSVCLCSHLKHYTLPFNLVIWQDPDEAKHPLSTAPLLERSIAGCQRLIGDTFEYRDLFGEAPRDKVALLYPADDQSDDQSDAAKGSYPETVLVLDGTWRKVRRLTLINPWLLDLPRVSLHPDKPSEYLRSSDVEGGVSTLEAVLMLADQQAPGRRYLEGIQVLAHMTELQDRARKKQ